MIQITPQVRILAAVEPVDFRKGIDGLCGLCRSGLVYSFVGHPLRSKKDKGGVQT